MDRKGLTRRDFLRVQLYGTLWAALEGFGGLGCGPRSRRDVPRVIVLGFDGMDPTITARMMREGKLPAFEKAASQGFLGCLGTSTPPQSPVAWSNFISGTNPGGHGIFDFVHRDPSNYLPYLSTSRTERSGKSLRFGDTLIPLGRDRVLDLRKGRAFWEILEDYDIPATILKIPSNFPPTATRQKTLSDMGTPDLLGSYGIFSYFSDVPVEFDPDIGGGRFQRVVVEGDTVRAALAGPKNPYRTGRPDSEADFTVYVDPEYPVAKIVIGDRQILLNQGEWSPWVEVAFRMAPGVAVKGICQFYLKEVHPHFKLYVTPIHLDPSDPALPISTPEDYASELARRFGPFHTKGLPADTKALEQGVLDEEEFLAFDETVLQERERLFDFELQRFESGLLFFYVSSTDQRSHMFWRFGDPQHPAFDPRAAERFGTVLEEAYRQADRILGKALAKADRNTLVLAISDHGFLPYYRSFHLNAWLRENGYLHLLDGSDQGDKEFFRGVDWSRTRAYALGFNGLYINQRGREARGSVEALEKARLVQEIAAKLEGVRDPVSGQRAVFKCYPAATCYSGPCRDEGPDLVVGYNRGYRASWQTALGKVPQGLFETNRKRWSGDHCMASDLLPGIVVGNRKPVRREGLRLEDVTATLLAAYGIPKPPEYTGKSIL
jgi:predicted AlkP superfamily phosphohydrolase/phosphomutase